LSGRHFDVIFRGADNFNGQVKELREEECGLQILILRMVEAW
jgi:hypothetical protein